MTTFQFKTAFGKNDAEHFNDMYNMYVNIGFH